MYSFTSIQFRLTGHRVSLHCRPLASLIAPQESALGLLLLVSLPPFALRHFAPEILRSFLICHFPLIFKIVPFCAGIKPYLHLAYPWSAWPEHLPLVLRGPGEEVSTLLTFRLRCNCLRISHLDVANSCAEHGNGVPKTPGPSHRAFSDGGSTSEVLLIRASRDAEAGVVNIVFF